MFFDLPKTTIPSPDRALPGRDTKMAVPERHAVLGSLLCGPWPEMAEIQVGMGCFWGAERKFWTVEGVICTAVGYGAGFTPNPTYQEVCSGQTGHNELVRIIFDPDQVSVEALLKVFWESHKVSYQRSIMMNLKKKDKSSKIVKVDGLGLLINTG